MGEMSRPPWKGTVVWRPSGWRNCLWDPYCRTSSKPRLIRTETTSLGFKTGKRVMESSRYRLGADELSLQAGFTILKEHRNHFPQVLIQLVEAGALAMSTGKSGNIAHEKARFRIPLDDGCKRSHSFPLVGGGLF